VDHYTWRDRALLRKSAEGDNSRAVSGNLCQLLDLALPAEQTAA